MNSTLPLFAQAEPTAMLPQGGWKIDRLEVKNFGGYHGRSSVFHCNRKGAIFSGDNGAGKSTALDAYRLLFVQYPSFNSATADNTKDRDIRSYLRGQYGSTDRGTTQQLRGPNTSFFSAIGVVWKDDGGMVFSAVRLLEIRGDKIEQRFLTAPCPINIDADFPDFPTPTRMEKVAQEKGGVAHSTLGEFFAACGEAYGIAEQFEVQRRAAFDLIDKTIGLKRLQSVSEFGRRHLLPPGDLSFQVNEVSDVLRKMQEIQATLDEEQRRIDSLKSVVTAIDTYETALDERRAIQLRKRQGERIVGHLTALRLRADVRTARCKWLATRRSITEHETAMQKAQDTYDAAVRLFAAKGGDKVSMLHTQREQLQQRLNATAKLWNDIEQVCAEARIPSPPRDNDAAYEAWIAKVHATTDVLVKQVQDHRNENDAEGATIHQSQTTIARLNEEITLLERSGSAIPPAQQKARDLLAEDLGCEPDDLPFCGSLVQVRAQNKDWTGVANRLLKTLGLSILVPKHLHQDARKALNARHWGTRITLVQIDTQQDTRPDGGKPQALWRKLEVRPDHPYKDAVESLLRERAHHACLSPSEFHGSNVGDAVTTAGSIKSGNTIQKNDQKAIDDASEYVLGWDVSAQIAAKKRELDDVRATLKRAQEQRAQRNTTIAAQDAKLAKIGQLETNWAIWAEQWNNGATENAHRTVVASLEVLESEDMRALEKAEHDAKRARDAAKDARDLLLKTEGSDERVLLNLTEQLNRERENLRDQRKNHGPLEEEGRAYMRRLIADAIGGEPGQAMKAFMRLPSAYFNGATDQAHSAMLHIKAVVQREAQRKDPTEKPRNDLVGEAKRHISAFPADKLTADVVESEGYRLFESRDRTHREDWRQELIMAETENLPSFKAKLQTLQENDVMGAITNLKTRVDQYNFDISLLEESVRSALEHLVYDPTTKSRAKIKIVPIRDSHSPMAKIREKLKAFNSERDKAAFAVNNELRKKQIVDLLNDINVGAGTEAGETTRGKILNLAEWYDVHVEEYTIVDGEEVVVRRYSGKGDGASGGEGERLAMLLIGAAFVHTFGESNQRCSRAGIRTVVLDEAFMHGSEAMAAAALRILTELGLQVIAATPAEKLMAFSGHAEQIFQIQKQNNRANVIPASYRDMENKARAKAGLDPLPKPVEGSVKP
jgi:uncharacterized protein YPO0396